MQIALVVIILVHTLMDTGCGKFTKHMENYILVQEQFTFVIIFFLSLVAGLRVKLLQVVVKFRQM